MNDDKLSRPDRIARIETELWEAYYNREWLREFRLLITMHREFFHMNTPTAVLASYDAARAAMAFAPLDANDLPQARGYLLRYYEKVRQALGCRATANDLAERESTTGSSTAKSLAAAWPRSRRGARSTTPTTPRSSR